MKLEIVGISGKAGSGKDYVGQHVFYPRGYAPWALSWHMKHEACGHGFSYEEVHQLKPPPVREFLQKRGTEQGWQAYGEDYWIRITEAWLRTLQEKYAIHRFYVPDVRFEHEARWIRRVGGKLVRLEHGMGLAYPLAGLPAAAHVSETALDSWTDWDVRFVNSTDGAAMTNLITALYGAGVLKIR